MYTKGFYILVQNHIPPPPCDIFSLVQLYTKIYFSHTLFGFICAPFVFILPLLYLSYPFCIILPLLYLFYPYNFNFSAVFSPFSFTFSSFSIPLFIFFPQMTSADNKIGTVYTLLNVYILKRDVS
jgi:hypothetical protein